MIYRTLGRTGLRVSQLGFGAMRLPMIEDGDEKRVDREKAMPMVDAAIDGGVNYFDTAVGYCNGDSQRFLGEALKSRRDQVVLSTKNHYYGEDESAWWQNLEDSLERLQTDHIDIYNHHGIGWSRWTDTVEPRLSKLMHKAKHQGIIKHICCSFHDSNEALIKIVDTGYPDVITLQYNLLDRSLEEGIAHAHANNVGVVVMGPVGGGRLGASTEALAEMLDEDVKRVPELALRFVLSNPHVSVALSGMSTIGHVQENIETASQECKLSDDQVKAVESHLERLKKMADLYCSGCRYCLPCPQEVNIPQIFQVYNEGRVYGLWDHARNRYRNLTRREKHAERCVECGACEEKCPQNIPIIEQLKTVHAKLAE